MFVRSQKALPLAAVIVEPLNSEPKTIAPYGAAGSIPSITLLPKFQESLPTPHNLSRSAKSRHLLLPHSPSLLPTPNG